MIVREYLKQLRKSHGMTMMEFSKKVYGKDNHSYTSHRENGTVKPTSEDIGKVSKYFNLSKKEILKLLLGGDEG